MWGEGNGADAQGTWYQKGDLICPDQMSWNIYELKTASGLRLLETLESTTYTQASKNQRDPFVGK